MPWFELVPSVLAAVVVFVVPGLAVGAATGLKGLTALTLAPAVSVTVIALSAVAFASTPWSWSVWMPLLAAAVLGAAALLVRRLAPSAAGRVRSGGRSGEPALDRGRWISGEQVAGLAALVLAAVLWARLMLRVLGSPDAISQTYDNVFHLNAIRFIRETGSGSSLELGRMVTGESGGVAFYPAAFHDVVSLVWSLAPGPLPFAVNGTLLVLLCLVWPLSCLFLLRAIVRPTVAGYLATAVLSASFTAFPLLLVEFGVLYPNLLGLVLLPVAIALGAQLFRVTPVGRVTTRGALLLGALTLPGIALAHPNVVMTFFVVMVPILVVRAYRQFRALGAGDLSALPALAQIAGIIALLVAIRVFWGIVRPAAASSTWLPSATTQEAVGAALLNATTENLPAWAVSAIMGYGMYTVIRRRTNLWLLGAWGLIVFLWVVIVSWEQGPARMLLTGIWYNDSIRYSATIPMAALPLAMVGASDLGRRLAGWWEGLRAEIAAHRGSAESGGGPTPGTSADWVADRPRTGSSVVLREADRDPRQGTAAIGAGVVVAGLLLVTTQFSAYLDHQVRIARATYASTAAAPLLSPSERALIQRLPELLPADAVVATDPWNGSSLAYALAGQPTTTTHVQAPGTPELETLRLALDEAATDPAVCPALDTLDADYVLDFGQLDVAGNSEPYPGFRGLESSPGFEEVASEGRATLYEITACDGSAG